MAKPLSDDDRAQTGAVRHEKVATRVGHAVRHDVLDIQARAGVVGRKWQGGQHRTGVDIAEAWRLLTRSGGRIQAGELARRVGWSPRYLQRRLLTETGLAPKAAARVTRFDRARRTLQRQATGAPDLFHLLHAGNAGHHGAEDDWCNQHLHKLDECVAQRLHFGAGMRVQVPNGHADCNGDEHLEVKTANHATSEHDLKHSSGSTRIAREKYKRLFSSDSVSGKKSTPGC